MPDILDFDVESWLEEKGIRFSLSGKNVTRGWVNIPCPFCGDHSNHLGISPQRLFHCWVCGEKGDIYKLIMEIEGCDFWKAKNIVSEYQNYSLNKLKQDIQIRNAPQGEVLPSNASRTFEKIHLDYLTSRNFNPEEIVPEYDLYACYNIGDYKFRIIIPVYYQGKIVNFTARSVVNGASPKYKHCPNNKAIIPMKGCVYNLDAAKDIVIIVEGVTDVWRLGPGSVAVMGTEFTHAQVKLIKERKFRKAFVMFDSEPKAIVQAYALASELDHFIDSVQVIQLDEGDPGDLKEEDVQYIRRNYLR